MSPIFASLLLAVGLIFFAVTMRGRLRVLAAMKKEKRTDNPSERAERLLLFGLGQKRMVDPEERGPGTMHVLIFAAFMVLAVRTIMLFVMGFSHSSDPFWTEHPTWGVIFNVYLLSKDLLAAGAFIGAAYFWYLRWIVKPDRMTPSWEGYLILAFIMGLMLTEFVFGASHMIFQGRGFVGFEPVTSSIALLLTPLSLFLHRVRALPNPLPDVPHRQTAYPQRGEPRSQTLAVEPPRVDRRRQGPPGPAERVATDRRRDSQA